MAGIDKELSLDDTENTTKDDSQNQSFELLKQIVDKKQEQTKLQGPNIPYLASQVLSKLSHGSASNVVRDLKALTPDMNKKNLSKKVLQLFDELSVFYVAQSFGADSAQTDAFSDAKMSALMTQLLQVLVFMFGTTEEPKVIRYIHFLFSDLNFKGDNKGAILKTLSSEYQKATYVNKIYAMKSVGRISLLSTQKNDILQAVVSETFKQHANPDAAAQKKTLKTLITDKVLGDKEKIDKNLLLQMTLQVLRQNSKDIDPSFLQYIVNLTRSKDAITAREALQTIRILADENSAVLQSVRSILPKFMFDEKKTGQWSYSSIVEENQKETKKQSFYKLINAESPVARSNLARICGINLPLLSTIVSKLGVQENVEVQQTLVIFSKIISADELIFVECLKYLIHDPELMVFFDTVMHATSKSFAILLEGYPKDNVKIDPKASKPDMKQNIPLLNYVVNRFSNSLKYDVQIQLHAALRSVYSLVSSYQAYKQAFPSHINKNTSTIMQNLYSKLDELLLYDCPHVRFQAFRVMLWSEYANLNQVIYRVKMEIKGVGAWKSFHLHELLLCLLDYSCVDKKVFDYFSDLCSYICIYCSDNVDLDLLISIFKQIVDVCEEKNLKEGFLHMIFNILDECLTGSKECIDLTFSIFNFLGEYANKLTREPSISARPVINDAMLNPDQTLTPDEIKQRQEIYDIQNGAMRSIVLRLLKGAMYQTPQIRICCVEALAKIAFRSLDPIRLFVYECLSYLASVDNFGVSAQCSNVLKVLDELYILQQAFLKLTTRSQTPQEILKFFNMHERIKEKIGFYCVFAPSFLPLGIKTKDILKQGYALRQQMAQQSATTF